MGREDLRTVGLIGFGIAAALGIWLTIEGIRYTDPEIGDPLASIITIVGIALTVLAASGTVTVLLAYRSDRR